MSPAPARKSLRERNREAIALTPADAQDPPALQEAPQTVQAPAEPAGAPAEARAAAKSGGASSTTRLGLYLTPQEFTDAKAAYLADWNAGGQADTIARWVAAAIDTHAARSTAERAQLARPVGRAAERTGTTRSFGIPSDTAARMRAAITNDQQADRWPSASAWCGDAIAAAVAAARRRDKGRLPTPPARLPNRLSR